ncbi:MAG: hypothetical protein WCT28_02815 [Patescibacteria group bacterium]|jgi:hypothetical protein
MSETPTVPVILPFELDPDVDDSLDSDSEPRSDCAQVLNLDGPSDNDQAPQEAHGRDPFDSCDFETDLDRVRLPEYAGDLDPFHLLKVGNASTLEVIHKVAIGKVIVILMSNSDGYVIGAMVTRVERVSRVVEEQRDGRRYAECLQLFVPCLLSGRPINFVSHRSGAAQSFTASGTPCAVLIPDEFNTVESILEDWGTRNPDLEIFDRR